MAEPPFLPPPHLPFLPIAEAQLAPALLHHRVHAHKHGLHGGGRGGLAGLLCVYGGGGFGDVECGWVVGLGFAVCVCVWGGGFGEVECGWVVAGHMGGLLTDPTAAGLGRT